MKASRALAVALALTFLIPIVFVPLQPALASSSSSSLTPATLKLTPIPPTLPASGNTYRGLIVSVLTSSGAPALAIQPIQITLVSSNEAVANVTGFVIIKAGMSFVVANVTTTTAAGTTLISASSPGFASESATITTASSSGVPVKIITTPIPSNSEINGNGVIGVTVENSQGVPVQVSKLTVIDLSLSNPGIITVGSSLTLKVGMFSSLLNYTAAAIGETSITASGSGMSSGIGTVNVESTTSSVQSGGSGALSLAMSPEPGAAITLNHQGVLEVSLFDASGNAVTAPATTTVLLFSSNSSIISVPSSVTLSKGSLFAVVPFNALNLGPSEITATANGLGSATQTLKVTPEVAKPTGLSISIAPANIPANGTPYQSVFVSLIEGSAPAVTVNQVTVTLTTSNTNIGTIDSSVTIPAGGEYAAATFTGALVSGTTVITAASTGLASSQTKLSTYSATELSVNLTPFAINLPTGKRGVNVLGVSITSSSGVGIPVSTPTTINLNTSDSGIIGVPPSVTIPTGSDFAMIPVTTSGPGSAVIEAAASGYQSSSISITASTIGPYQAALYAAPITTVTLNGAGSSIFVIQLQDSNGNPVDATSDIALSLVPSNLLLYNETVPIQVTPGETEVMYSAPFLGSGNSSFSLSGAGLHLPAPITLYTTAITPNIAFQYSPQSVIYTKSTVTVSVVISLGGSNLQGVDTIFQIAGTNYSETTNSAGSASITFVTPDHSGSLPVIVNTSDPLFGSVTKPFSIFVTPAPKVNIYTKLTWPPEIILGLPPQISLSATLLIVIAAVAAVGIFSWRVKHNLFFLHRKKVKRADAEDNEEEEEESDEE